MQLLLPIAIGLVLAINTLACQTNCCHNSQDCCKSSTDCCSTSCCQETSKCCDQTSNCCQKKPDCCKTSDCCRDKSNKTCENRCEKLTCGDQCEQNCTNPSVEPVKEKIIDRREGSSSSSSNNENNINLSGAININNTVNNENRVYIPINITNNNINNIVITSRNGSPPSPPIVTYPTTSNENTSTNPTTPCSTQTIKVPIPIPVPSKPVLAPVPYPIPYPISQPTPGCCIIVNPCCTIGCHPYQRTCGQECSHHFMYRPVNPCEDQCKKRPYAINRYCHEAGHCSQHLVDCSMCDENSYDNYDSYLQCGGCFYR